MKLKLMESKNFEYGNYTADWVDFQKINERINEDESQDYLHPLNFSDKTGQELSYEDSHDLQSEEFMNTKILYRIGEIHNNAFFTDNLDYYSLPPFDRNSNDAVKYIVNMDCKIFDPMNEMKLYINVWSDIRGKIEDFTKFGIEDECDFELEDEWGVTSTDGLAIAGEKLGVDMTIIRDIPNNNGCGKKFTEYVIHNPNIIKEVVKNEI